LPQPANAPDAGDEVPVEVPHPIARFSAAMAASGPFEGAPFLAAAVSGGADSMALAMFAADWVHARGGGLLALVVDHGLRRDSAAEAALTVSGLRACGTNARLLTLSGLAKGPGLAERARHARYRALAEACAENGILHLLLGHHASDQAETMMIRVLSGSGARGLAGIAGVAESGSLRLVRPLLTVPPAWLRAFLIGRDVAWVEDPSNQDPTASRARIRRLRQDTTGEGNGTLALVNAARRAGVRRSMNDAAVASVLANRVTLRPEGFALLSPGAIAPEALAELLRTIAGAPFVPPIDQIAAFAANPKPQTIGGVRVTPAGRMGDGWLLVREQAAATPPVAARDGALWDSRFRLRTAKQLPHGTMLGALGDAAARLRRHSDLPTSVLSVMPALWRRNILVAVPQLHYPDVMACEGGCRLVFDPPRPLSGAPFCPA
jgi:tRNA(Ile)-lysidine synthase